MSLEEPVGLAGFVLILFLCLVDACVACVLSDLGISQFIFRSTKPIRTPFSPNSARPSSQAQAQGKNPGVNKTRKEQLFILVVIKRAKMIGFLN